MNEPLKRSRAAALFEEHGRAVRAFIAARVRDLEVADNLCQEVFLVALQRGVPQERARPWLFGVAHKKVLKHYRDGKAPQPLASEPPALGLGPEELARRDERAARIRAAIASLPEEQRELLLLRAHAGLTYQQIADALGVTHATIQNRLKRARAELSKLLQDREEVR